MKRNFNTLMQNNYPIIVIFIIIIDLINTLINLDSVRDNFYLSLTIETILLVLLFRYIDDLTYSKKYRTYMTLSCHLILLHIILLILNWMNFF